MPSLFQKLRRNNKRDKTAPQRHVVRHIEKPHDGRKGSSNSASTHSTTHTTHDGPALSVPQHVQCDIDTADPLDHTTAPNDPVDNSQRKQYRRHSRQRRSEQCQEHALPSVQQQQQQQHPTTPDGSRTPPTVGRMTPSPVRIQEESLPKRLSFDVIPEDSTAPENKQHSQRNKSHSTPLPKPPQHKTTSKKGFLFRSAKNGSSSSSSSSSSSPQENTGTANAHAPGTSLKPRSDGDGDASVASSASMSATVIPTGDGTFVSSATMKRRQRVAASSSRTSIPSKRGSIASGASKAVSSSLQAARGMMAFRKAKKNGAKSRSRDNDHDHDDDFDSDLLCRIVGKSPVEGTSSPSRGPRSTQNGQQLTPAQLRAQRRETERIARAAAALDNKGNALFERGYYDQAMGTYTKALRLKRRTFHTLLDEADNILDEALEGKNLVRDSDKADAKLLVSMATSINNIGYLRQRSGEATHEETMAAYRKSLRIKREILGKDSLSVGKTLNNIGSVHYLKREFSDSLLAYREALEIMRANLGENDKDVATVWSNMGDVYWAMNRQKERALEHYRQALNIRWDNFGEHDSRVVRLLEKIAAIEIGDKMLEQTESLQRGSASAAIADDDDLLDLDRRPVVQELHLLHSEVERDMIYVDLMQKRMKVDMVKDKVNILRGMRMLEESSKQQMELLETKDAAAAAAQVSGGSGSDSPTGDVSAIDAAAAAAAASTKPAAAKGAPFDREAALQKVKARLARLREQRGFKTSKDDTANKSVGESTQPGPKSDGRREGDATALCGAAMYKAQFQRPTLSSLEAAELRQELDSVRSALVLKQGIDSLRSFAVSG